MEKGSPEITSNHHQPKPEWINRNRQFVGGFAVVAVALLALGYGYHQQLKIRHLSAQQLVADATVSGLQRQLSSLTEKLNGMAATPQPAAVAPKRTRKQPAGTPLDQRYERLKAELTEQQRQLKETQDLLAKNRADLEENLNSTRDELNGSIAKTHEEVVALAKRGERSYFEFDLVKSKQFQRFGPLPLSLRKTDTKHNSFDMTIIVNDKQLTKKKVNLYEPIWIHEEDQSQPLQVVVNGISKDLVHGYVSAPKYKPSELALTGSTSASPVASPRNPAGDSTKPE